MQKYWVFNGMIKTTNLAMLIESVFNACVVPHTHHISYGKKNYNIKMVSIKYV